MNFLPLCTARVWPTNSGRMVERRDHVFSTFFWRERFSSSTRLSSRSSTYGPFLSERPIPPPISSDASRCSGPTAARRAASCSLGGPPPRRHGVVALALSLAATHRMIHRVHDRAADRGPETLPPDAPGLADGDVLVIQVAHLPDGGHALQLHLPDLARGQLDIGVVALLREQLGQGAGAAAELAALARLELHVVHEGAQRDVADRQSIAGQDIGLRARHHRVPRLEPQRGDDVALLAVAVMQEGDASRAVWIVFDPGYPGGNPELLAPEIDLPQHALVPAAPVTDRDPAVHVPSTSPALGTEEVLLRFLLRDLLVGDEGHVPAGGRGGLDRSDAHGASKLGGGLRPPSETFPQDSVAPARPALEPRSCRANLCRTRS